MPRAGSSCGLTKGVHLVIDAQRLPIPHAVVMTEGPRVLFAIPYGQRVILGTTDTDYAGRPELVRTEDSDVDYILRIVNRTFSRGAAYAGGRDYRLVGGSGADRWRAGPGSPSELFAQASDPQHERGLD